MSLESVIKSISGAVEVSAMDVYSDLFHLGEHLIQRTTDKKGEYLSNPILYYQNFNEGYYDKNGKERVNGHYRVLFEDTFEEVLKEGQEADFSILNGITYFGRKNVQAHASKMFGFIFDLDGLDKDDKWIRTFFYQAYNNYIPLPNYIIMSGNNAHLYYIFERPVCLYPNIKKQMKSLKYALIDRIWNTWVSPIPAQHQGINQGFRVIGGKTKIENVRVRAFRLHTTPYDLNTLNEYVDVKYRIDETKLYRESAMSLSEAKEKYPEWYQKRVIEKQSKGTWTCNRGLYDWWIRKIKEPNAIHHGNRYYVIMCLAIFAVKSGISKEELKKDAYSFIEPFQIYSDTDIFSKSDVDSALKCFDESFKTFPRKDIEKISGIIIQRAKRKKLKQSDHLKVARYMRDEIYMKKDTWGNKNGAPKKDTIIQEYIAKHPNASITEISKALGISRPTIYKWKNISKVNTNTVKNIHSAPTKQELIKTYFLQNPNATVSDVAKGTGLSRQTIYKWLQFQIKEKIQQSQNNLFDGDSDLSLIDLSDSSVLYDWVKSKIAS